MLFFSHKHDERIKTERLYEQYKNMLIGVANNILYDHALAEDAVHDTFERLLKYVPKLDENDYHKTGSFLVVICRNAAKDIYKKNKNSGMLDELIDEMNYSGDDDKNPLNITITNESVRRIIDAIKRLNGIYQDVVLLKYVIGCTNEEISQLIKIPQATVRKRLERGKRELEKILDKEEIR